MNRFALPSFLQSRVLSTVFGVSESATNCAIYVRHYATFPGNKNMNCTLRGFLDIEEVRSGVETLILEPVFQHVLNKSFGQIRKVL
jgi:hypothetical protein